MARRGLPAGFTLVELLIVILILGILAAVVIPQVSVSSDDAQASALFMNLSLFRKAIELYHVQHRDTYPGTISGVSTWSNFGIHMTSRTNKNGDPGTDYGPYLGPALPRNPYNNLNTGEIGLPPPEGNISFGWYYNPPTGEIYPAWPAQAVILTKEISKVMGESLGVKK